MITASDVKKRKVSEADSEVSSPVAQLLVKRLSERGKLPTRGSALAAGYDLYRYASQLRLNPEKKSYN